MQHYYLYISPSSIIYFIQDKRGSPFPKCVVKKGIISGNEWSLKGPEHVRMGRQGLKLCRSFSAHSQMHCPIVTKIQPEQLIWKLNWGIFLGFHRKLSAFKWDVAWKNIWIGKLLITPCHVLNYWRKFGQCYCRRDAVHALRFMGHDWCMWWYSMGAQRADKWTDGQAGRFIDGEQVCLHWSILCSGR